MPKKLATLKGRDLRALDLFRDRLRSALGRSMLEMTFLSRRAIEVAAEAVAPRPKEDAGLGAPKRGSGRLPSLAVAPQPEPPGELLVAVRVERRDAWVEERLDAVALEVALETGALVTPMAVAQSDPPSPHTSLMASEIAAGESLFSAGEPEGAWTGPEAMPGSSPTGPAHLDRAALSRDFLARARDALGDAQVLSGAGTAHGVALRAADAALLGARALLAARGYESFVDFPAAMLLFDRQLVATDHVSRACGEAMHRAFRASREVRAADPHSFYTARVRALCDGAAALLAEAEIVLERDLETGPARAPRVDEDA